MVRLPDKDYFEMFERISSDSEALLDIISSEKFLLERISYLFSTFERRTKLEDFEKGIFAKRISRDSLRKFLNAHSSGIPPSSDGQVKRVHKLVLRKYSRESSVLSRLTARILSLSVKLKPFLEGHVVKKVSLGVYVGTYICFFFGIFDYPLFSFTTTLAREVMTA